MYFAVIYMYLGVKLATMTTIVKFYWPSVRSSLSVLHSNLVTTFWPFLYQILAEKGSFQCVQNEMK